MNLINHQINRTTGLLTTKRIHQNNCLFIQTMKMMLDTTNLLCKVPWSLAMDKFCIQIQKVSIFNFIKLVNKLGQTIQFKKFLLTHNHKNHLP